MPPSKAVLALSKHHSVSLRGIIAIAGIDMQETKITKATTRLFSLECFRVLQKVFEYCCLEDYAGYNVHPNARAGL